MRVDLIEEREKNVLSSLCLERDGRRGQVVLEGFFLNIWQVHGDIDHVLEKGLVGGGRVEMDIMNLF
jgi:hypothetical protein